MKAAILVGIVVAVLITGNTSLLAEEATGKSVVDDPLDQLEVTATKVSERPGENGRLSFTLRNTGSRSVKVMEDYLPWKTACVLKLVAVPFAKGLGPVEPMQPIVDPTPTILEIAGNAELHGELNVSPFFPQWNKLVNQGMVLVWSFSLYDVETGYDKRFSGVVEYRAKRR
jgi:hypothetical protein